MNNITIFGRLTKDPELRKTVNDKDVVNLTIADYFDKDHTNFINCVAFGKISEIILNSHKKGDAIAVMGVLKVSSYTDKKGINRITHNVIINSINFKDKTTISNNANPGEDLTSGDDLPF